MERCSIKLNASTAVLLFAFALQGVSNLAGEAEQPLPPAPPVNPNPAAPDKPGQPGDKNSTTVNALDENYVFDANGRRDPFTFTKAVVLERGPDDPTGVVVAQGDPELPKEVREKKRNAAELACNAAESALMELDPKTAISFCEKGMEEFKDVPEITKYPELEVAKGRLLRARKASEQMSARQTAERDFKSMSIKITGLTVMKKNSQAIINSEIVHKGSMIKSGVDTSDIMVDEILPERVVFLFRGYRMNLLLSDAGGK